MLLQHYSGDSFFDEMALGAHPSGVRNHYQRFLGRFGHCSESEFEQKRRAVDLAFLRQGITFNVYGDSEGAERIFPFDLVPRIIPASEWELLERGLLVPRLIAGGGWVFEPQPSILEATPPDGMLPADVREMILRRLGRLSSPARDLLAAGAILGYDFTFEELCQVARLAPQEGLAAMDEALQSLLLYETSQRRDGRSRVSYHFADDKVREVVYAGAGDARRRVFHGRALTVREHADVPRRGAGLSEFAS